MTEGKKYLPRISNNGISLCYLVIIEQEIRIVKRKAVLMAVVIIRPRKIVFS
jgi:hypothetical protein